MTKADRKLDGSPIVGMFFLFPRTGRLANLNGQNPEEPGQWVWFYDEEGVSSEQVFETPWEAEEDFQAWWQDRTRLAINHTLERQR